VSGWERLLQAISTAKLQEEEPEHDWKAIIRQFRKERMLSKTELGKMVGVSHAAIIRWEQGTAVPRHEHRRKLVEIIN
jgi:ribosome-binding protein aMBF1 (putative translation factor)